MDLAINLKKNKVENTLFNFLFVLISFGLIIQTSLVFWPLGNYATLVYVFFYLPLLALLILHPKYPLNLLKYSDLTLLVLILVFLCWVLSTSLWSNDNLEHQPLFGKTLKNISLVLFFIVGIAILASKSQLTIHRALLTISLVASVVMIITIINEFKEGDYFSQYYRLELIGSATWHKAVNPVVIGIYSGWLTCLASLLLVDSFQQKKPAYLQVIIFLSLISFITIMFLARSRTALFAIMIFYLMYLVINNNLNVIIYLALAFFTFLLVSLAFENPVVLSTINRGGLAGFRPEIWKEAWLHSLENLWFGAGIWSDTSIVLLKGDIAVTQMHSHNFYLQLINWTGLIGLGLYLALLYRSTQIAFQLRDSFIGRFTLLTLVYFVVVQLFDVYNIFTKPSYYWPCIWLPIGILVGHTARLKKQARKEKLLPP